MRRREFITLFGGVAVAPWSLGVCFVIQRAVAADTIRTIGLLSPFTRSDTEAWHQAFREGLRDLGWVEGENIKIEYRYADGIADRLPKLAADLVSRNVAIIVVAVTPDAMAA